MGDVKHVRGPDTADDGSFLDLRSGNDQNLSADIAGDEPRKNFTLLILAAAKPVANVLEHLPRPTCF